MDSGQLSDIKTKVETIVANKEDIEKTKKNLEIVNSTKYVAKIGAEDNASIVTDFVQKMQILLKMVIM